MAAKFLLACMVLLAVSYTAHGLQCYVCGAGTDGCGPSFGSTGTGVTKPTISTGSGDSCTKTVYDSNNNVISRGITGSCSAGHSAANTGTGADGSTLYCCTTDLCNGGSMKMASLTFAFAVAALSLFYMI